MIKKGSGLVCVVALGVLLGPSCCVLNYVRPLIPCVPPASHLPSEACLGAQAPVLLRLRGGEGQEGADSEQQRADITDEQARVLLDSAGGEVAALLKTLSDYRESAQVQEQGCKRILRAFAAVAANISASEDLRSCYVYAGGAKCILESLRVHSHAPLALVTALCKALGMLLDGPPNQAAKGDDVYNDDCVATLSGVRVASGRAGAAKLALALIKEHSEALTETVDNKAGEEKEELVCAAYYIIELLALDYENKEVFAQVGALPVFVAHLRAFSSRPSVVMRVAGALVNCASSHDQNKLSIASAGATPHILGFMDAYASNARVCLWGCALIGNLAAEASLLLQKQLCSAGAVQRIIRAMQEHADAAEVQQEACAALVNLARGNVVTRELIRAAGAEVLARAALKRHRASLRVQHYAQWCIGHLLVH